ncbi:NAD(P)/FAD-dependent oxidoreductase [Arthrobacter sp. S2(2024)]|uniref:NAD(P)/FAD-dependent oxidoreductase n=1 Tax=Arthrobacter sp. S2(2024) TaxID=3111911 RepID=UPI002FC90280
MSPAKPTFFEEAERLVDSRIVEKSLSSTVRYPFWLDSSEAPEPLPPLDGHDLCDLAVIGGGYTGLWTALIAKEQHPERTVVLLEASRVGGEASGRNGGFCEASLVHGESNGELHLPAENEKLTQLGLENLQGILSTLEKYGIDCDLQSSGRLQVATEEHQVQWLRDEANGPQHRFYSKSELGELIKSDAFLAGLWTKGDTVLVNPAKLAWGLRRVCLQLGVRIYESTPALKLKDRGITVEIITHSGAVTANKVALATNAFPSLLKRHRFYTVPVYDYALVTEPLTEQQRQAIGWTVPHGLSDLNNRFHYARPIIDDDGQWRILYGGYDALYRFGGKIDAAHYDSEATYRKLVAHFIATFPELSDLKFSHAWGGVIDTCSRFFAFFDISMRGKVAYCAGFTGLGVAATRFGARAMLDLLSGQETQITMLEMVRRKPLPFPPEPVAWLGVKAMSAALFRADRRKGRRGPLLRIMDAIGMGFDS